MKDQRDAYTAHQAQTDLAMRMIAHEARTGTIRLCTGLTEDRIRKLYNRYFVTTEGSAVRRRRGKTPRQPAFFLRSPAVQLEATTLAGLYITAGILAIVGPRRLGFAMTAATVEFGSRFCDAYESYQMLHAPSAISFERAWNLLQALARNNELGLSECTRCGTRFVRDTLALGGRTCPGCQLSASRGESRCNA